MRNILKTKEDGRVNLENSHAYQFKQKSGSKTSKEVDARHSRQTTSVVRLSRGQHTKEVLQSKMSNLSVMKKGIFSGSQRERLWCERDKLSREQGSSGELESV